MDCLTGSQFFNPHPVRRPSATPPPSVRKIYPYLRKLASESLNEEGFYLAKRNLLAIINSMMKSGRHWDPKTITADLQDGCFTAAIYTSALHDRFLVIGVRYQTKPNDKVRS